MTTAVLGVDVIRKGHDTLVVAVIVLQCNFRKGIIQSSRNIDNFSDCFITSDTVDMLHKLTNTALIVQNFRLHFLRISGIRNYNPDSGIQESLFSHAFEKDFIVIASCLKDFGICLESNHRTSFCGLVNDFQWLFVFATVKMLEVDIFTVFDGNFQPFRKCIHDRCADTMQTAGNLITATAKLTAGMKDSINDCCRRNALSGVNSCRNPSTVIRDTDDIIRENFNLDFCAVPCQCFINGIVHNLIDQMMQTINTGRADIHTWTDTNRLKTFQDLNLFRTIAFFFHFFTLLFP